MNVAVVYFGRNAATRSLAEDLAREARTHAITPDEYDKSNVLDLLVVGIDCVLNGHRVTSEIDAFFEGLDREHIKNVAIFSLFKIRNGLLDYVVDKCNKNDLPLLRDQYVCKMPMLKKASLNDNILQGARVYIDDMITIVQNYY